jgi:hypothetical protein
MGYCNGWSIDAKKRDEKNVMKKCCENCTERIEQVMVVRTELLQCYQYFSRQQNEEIGRDKAGK